MKHTPLWLRIEANWWRLGSFLVAYVLVLAFVLGSIIAVPTYLLLDLMEASGETRLLYVIASYPLLGTITSILVLVTVLGDVKALTWGFDAVEVPTHDLPVTRQALADASVVTGLSRVPALYSFPADAVNAFVLAGLKGRPIIGVSHGFAQVLDEHAQMAVLAVLLTRIQTRDAQLITTLSRVRSPLGFLGEMTTGVAHPMAMAVAFAAWIAGLGYERACWLSALRGDAEALLRLKDPRQMSMALRAALGQPHVLIGEGVEKHPGVFFAWPLEPSAELSGQAEHRLARLAEVGGSEWE